MEGSSASSHEEERTATFYVYHPCYFLQQAFRALLRCLGIESEATMCSKAEEEKSSLSQTTAADDLITNSPSCNISHKNSQDAADPPSTTNQTIIIASSMARRGNRGSRISHGSGPQHN
ncbi:hypothetical protein AAZX31_20G160100 [Glycine max]|uniref:Uncharacterized protein n=2 Tax=Glycine subgen. Soja TaxID=1462606 RepID=K7N414_SOYBN|nr:hypothetical protein JHK86_056515 [Glycine max]KAG4910664.1 hypothetical protein JHK87_056780 [Glycine soja]KAG5077987.1 hypothetical protein JHK82_056682 [Glycine max]KAH1036564.1 hypothetical protein GYH30_056162 [Glycine max]KAH1036565.1 hypothetical protein GYH30_056162 [Glycine max]